MNYTHILGIDPSGNKSEGSGCTGLALIETKTKTIVLSDVRAADYETQWDYWNAIVEAIQKFPQTYLFVVIEDFRLDPTRALAQSHSTMETPKLIGVLQYLLGYNGIPYMLQQASQVKTRWSDEILLKTGILTTGGGERKRWYLNGTMTNDHQRDALRHAWHCYRFEKWRKE